jgi:hypothetical protein
VKQTKEQKLALIKKRIANKKVSAVGTDATVAAVTKMVEADASHPSLGVPVVASTVAGTPSEGPEEVVEAQRFHFVHPSSGHIFDRKL